MKGITTSAGKLINNIDDTLNPVIGYQAEHIVTGRLLPMCNRWEVYGSFEALTQKMGDVAEWMDENGIEFDIWEYDIVFLRESDITGGGYVLIN